MAFSAKEIKCQLCLALLFSGFASVSLAEVPPVLAPKCQVDAKIVSVSGDQAVVSVNNEEKIANGADKDRPCSFTKSKKVTIKITPDDAKNLKAGENISAQLQQTGSQSDVQINSEKIKVQK